MQSVARRALVALVCGASIAVALPGVVQGQDLHPSRRPSPVGIAKTHIGDTYVKVTYGRPYMRGRVIFGAAGDSVAPLVPYAQLWRTGANEATEITLTGPLRVAGQALPAGTYALFTEPGPSTWTLRFSPQLGLDGTGMIAADGTFRANVYDPSRDVLRVSVPTGRTEEVVEQFTITFEPTAAGAHMVLSWERTEVRVPVTGG